MDENELNDYLIEMAAFYGYSDESADADAVAFADETA